MNQFSTIFVLMILLQGNVFAQDTPAPLSRYEYSAPSMGSMLDIVVYAKDQQQAQACIDAGLNEVDRLSQILSNYDQSSEISQLCRSPINTPTPLSFDLGQVLQESLRWNKISNGKFDISVGRLTQLWRRCRKLRILPSEVERREALSQRKATYVAVEIDGSKVWHASFPTDGIVLDLSGIATGYILDRMLEKMTSVGPESILINAGGDIRVGKAPPEKIGWRIDVAGLGKESPALMTYWLEDGAVTTSGDLFQYVEIDGRRYSHLIDPDSGSPIERRQSVTVFASRAIDADAGATALAVLGMDEGSLVFPNLPLLRALVLQMDADGRDEAETVRLRVLENAAR
jgi:FAD:protein FMN transferase